MSQKNQKETNNQLKNILKYRSRMPVLRKILIRRLLTKIQECHGHHDDSIGQQLSLLDDLFIL